MHTQAQRTTAIPCSCQLQQADAMGGGNVGSKRSSCGGSSDRTLHNGLPSPLTALLQHPETASASTAAAAAAAAAGWLRGHRTASVSNLGAGAGGGQAATDGGGGGDGEPASPGGSESTDSVLALDGAAAAPLISGDGRTEGTTFAGRTPWARCTNCRRPLLLYLWRGFLVWGTAGGHCSRCLYGTCGTSSRCSFGSCKSFIATCYTMHHAQQALSIVHKTRLLNHCRAQGMTHPTGGHGHGRMWDDGCGGSWHVGAPPGPAVSPALGRYGGPALPDHVVWTPANPGFGAPQLRQTAAASGAYGGQGLEASPYIGVRPRSGHPSARLSPQEPPALTYTEQVAASDGGPGWQYGAGGAGSHFGHVALLPAEASGTGLAFGMQQCTQGGHAMQLAPSNGIADWGHVSGWGFAGGKFGSGGIGGGHQQYGGCSSTVPIKQETAPQPLLPQTPLQDGWMQDAEVQLYSCLTPHYSCYHEILPAQVECRFSFNLAWAAVTALLPSWALVVQEQAGHWRNAKGCDAVGPRRAVSAARETAICLLMLLLVHRRRRGRRRPPRRRRWEQDSLLVDSLEQLLPPQISQPPPADWGRP